MRQSTAEYGIFEVRLWGALDEIHLTIRDSGVGFDVEAAKANRGLGLISMQERLKLLNGTLSIESQLQHGTTIRASVPHRSDYRAISVPTLRPADVSAYFSKEKMRFQSFCMLITTQPSFFASPISASGKLPTWVSGSPPAGP